MADPESAGLTRRSPISPPLGRHRPCAQDLRACILDDRDVYHSGTSSGTNVDMYTCNGTAAQQWVLNDLGSGWFEIENRTA